MSTAQPPQSPANEAISLTQISSFTCNCSKERVEKALISIGKKELQEMIDEDKPIEVNCHFCGKTYKFDVDELKKMEKKSR